MLWKALAVLLSCLAGISNANAESAPTHTVLLRDITAIAGVRDNPLIGYGIVVGLHGTGDRQQTMFTTQALASAMERLGVQVPGNSIRVNNTAAVFVTATLPPFSKSGMQVDVTVSSIGDAKSLEGGVLLMTALHGVDGNVYAEAQGPLIVGGYSAGGSGNAKVVNHTTVGLITSGAIIERDLSIDITTLRVVPFILRNPDFTTATAIAEAVNREFGAGIAEVINSRQVNVDARKAGAESIPALISRVQELRVPVQTPAKVVVNERTGTIVMGGDVVLTPVSVLHGNLTIEVTTSFTVSQPNAFTNGNTVPVPQTDVKAREDSIQTLKLSAGANVDELINGLHAIGATARDIVAILQAIKAAGGLQAELEVL